MKKMQASYAAGVLAPSLHSRTDLAKWQIGLAQADNLLVHVHGGISNRPGTKYVADALGPHRLIPFEYSITDTYVLEFSDEKMRIIRDGALVEALGVPVEIVSPYAYADLAELRFVQREDVMYFTHPDYQERSLTRVDHDDWTFAIVSYEPKIGPPTTGLVVAVSPSTIPTTITPHLFINYKIACISASGEESLPSVLFGNNLYSAQSWAPGVIAVIDWDAVPAADLYVVYKSSTGTYGYVGSTTETQFLDSNIAEDINDVPKTDRDPFDGVGNYPTAVGVYQQRKVYGNTTNLPQTSWLTRSGTMDNMSVSRPVKDDDAISAQVDSNQVNQILHFVPMKELIVVTDSGTWTLGPGRNADAITPTAIRYDKDSSYGGSRIAPIVSGNSILVVPNYREGVREFFYQVQAGGMESSPLDVLSNHLFKNDTIEDWAFQRDESIIWCVMASGCINALTYMREHEVVAWTRIETEGSFESVCVVRSEEKDTIFFGVSRTIDGGPVRYIEQLTERLPANVLEDGVFMDASLSYDGAPADNFSGAEHLANETCVVLADGNVIEDVVVSGTGTFDLDNEYSKVHIGIPYVSDFETLDVDYNKEDGTGFGDVKAINKVTLAVENTRGLQVGPTSDDLTEMKDRTTEGYDEATNMITSKVDIQIQPHWNSNGRVHVRQSYPLPMTILSHIPEVMTGDD